MIRVTRTVGLLAVGLLGAGIVAGALAAVDTATPHDPAGGAGQDNLWVQLADAPDSGSPEPTMPGGSTATSGPSGSMLSANPPATGSGPTGSAEPPADDPRTAVPGLRRWLRQPGLHGEVVIEAATGFVTVAMQRGVVEAVDTAAIVVRSHDEVVQTWQIGAFTVVRADRVAVPLSDLGPGDSVEVVGVADGSTLTAHLIRLGPIPEPG